MVAETAMVPWRRTVLVKVVSVSIISATLVLGVAGYFSYAYIKTAKIGDLAQLAEVTATRISRHIELPMWNVDTELVNKQLEAEMKEARIAGIRVRDEDGKTLLAARERRRDGTVVESAGDVIGDYIVAHRDIYHDTRIIGSATVFISQALLDRELTRFAWGVCIVIVIFDLLMITILSLVLRRFVVTPMAALGDHIERISRGDLNRGVEVRSDDEIGQLATALNRMQRRLRTAIARFLENKQSVGHGQDHRA